jgi:hypothetical protein
MRLGAAGNGGDLNTGAPQSRQYFRQFHFPTGKGT